MNSLNHFMDMAVSLALDVGLRATIVLLVTMLLVTLLKQSSASARRLVWIGGLSSVIILPLLTVWGPTWPLAVTPRPHAETVQQPAATSRKFELTVAARAPQVPANQTRSVDDDLLYAATERNDNRARSIGIVPQSMPFRINWRAIAFTVLVFGASIQFLRTLVSVIRVRRLLKASSAIAFEDWHHDWRVSKQRLGLQSDINLRETETAIAPMACGLVRASVVFPAMARRWSRERRRAVMLHELAHVRQRDVIVILLANAASTIYFFHPLIWLAVRKLRQECERSCDDLVLHTGHTASDYAGHLTAIARTLATCQRKSVMAVAMSQTSNIEQRVSAILDSRQRRGRPSPMISAVVISMLILLGLIAAAPRYATAQNRDSLDATEAPSRRLLHSTHRSDRNNVYEGDNIPVEWDMGSGRNILWSNRLGSATYASPVVADGIVFVGTNNPSVYIERFPADQDLGCLLAFDSQTGTLLWQYSAQKLESGRVNDWPFRGISSTPYVDDGRLWFVNNRSEVVCLDVDGFRDGRNDGPVRNEVSAIHEADVIWSVDLMTVLGSFPHNHSDCSITSDGRFLFIVVPNGVDETHRRLPAPNAPSFVALDRSSGAVAWATKASPPQILHGQWSSAAIMNVNGVNQVICPCGNGWLYGLDAGTGKAIWKFDCNPSEAQWSVNGRGRRNNLIGMPLVYEGSVYIATGQDPEHGEGEADLWCIDPNGQGDVSATIRHEDKNVTNPGARAVWAFSGLPTRQGQKKSHDGVLHRCISTPAAKDGLLFVSDLSGLVHCFDAKSGERHWVHDLLAACYASPVIVDDRVYVADEDGDVTVLELSSKLNVISEMSMDEAIYSTPVVDNNVLYVTTKSRIVALRTGANSLDPVESPVRPSAAVNLETHRRRIAALRELSQQSRETEAIARSLQLRIRELEQKLQQSATADGQPSQ